MVTANLKRVFPFLPMASVLAGAGAAGASVFSSLTLQEELSTYYAPTAFGQYLPRDITSAPFQVNDSLDSGGGGSVSATHNVYDNGSTAGFSTVASASATSLYNSLGSFSGVTNNEPTSVFSFTVPVTYMFSLSTTGTQAGTGVSLGTSPNGDNIINLSPMTGTTYTYSGSLSANMPYYLTEDWLIANTSAHDPADISGTESVSFAFTAIPEPASLAIFAAALPAAFRRRRRPDNVGGDAGGGPISSTGPDLASMPNGGE